ncbi:MULTISPECIES: D-alanyl-D-alanine carboxypeptidase family protein [Bacillaceae]|uniref:serine-type D-Ala-D-Ala carboxypeptidase n=1 Tax=Evansella alkalicola TaxID=745819 RepID=A0ABS6JSF5_9BACI|nr:MULTISPECIES: D-alanyl-D-alanine carboxypeptidase family protein [Bacillaceae]MBU9721502.1 D-alanyl-D-alanine carboxypeptidase [Bacillus alkalicola]
MIKRIGIISLLFVFTFISTFGFNVGKANANFETKAKAAIMIDADSGLILYEKNIDQPLLPASMVKMMSEYLVLEAVNNGDISWDQHVPVSDYLTGADSLSHDRRLSNVPLRPDETYTVKELYESVAIYSANASTIALAELISGSYGAFVEKMNEKGQELGMGTLLRDSGLDLSESAELGLGDFQFVNSTGLRNTEDHMKGHHPSGTSQSDNNYMTARATATLAYHLINDYPEVLDTAKIPEMLFKEGTEDEIKMENWNWMLPGSLETHLDYEYIDGLKTGGLGAGFNSFTGTAVKDGRRLITVVMELETREERFTETKRLMDYGFSIINDYSTVELFPADMVIDEYETLPVVKGKEREVSISTADSVNAFVHKDEEDSYSYSVELFYDDEELFDEDGNLIAPIEENQVIGKLIIEYTGSDEKSYIEGAGQSIKSVDIVTDTSVEQAGWFSQMMRGIGGFFSGIWNSVADTVRGWF